MTPRIRSSTGFCITLLTLLALLGLLGLLPPASEALAQTTPSARPAPVQLEKLHGIGCAACSGAEAFSGVQDILVRDDGSVILADGSPPFVRAFGPDGSPLFQATTRGEGPGEARSVTGLARLADGRIIALDMRLRRLIVLDASGAVLDTRRTRDFPLALHGADDGSGFWTIETDFRNPARFFFWPADGTDPTPVEVDPSTLGVATDDLPFQLYSAAAGPEGRLALGDGEHAYRIDVFDTRGRKLYGIARDVPRTPKTAREIEDERASKVRARGRLARELSGGDSPEEGALGRDIEIDPLHRHFLSAALALDPSGRLWVKTPRGGDRATVFDLFDERGGYLGEVEVEGRIARYAVGDDFLATVVTDALDVETVRLWRVGAS